MYSVVFEGTFSRFAGMMDVVNYFFEYFTISGSHDSLADLFATWRFLFDSRKFQDRETAEFPRVVQSLTKNRTFYPEFSVLRAEIMEEVVKKITENYPNFDPYVFRESEGKFEPLWHPVSGQSLFREAAGKIKTTNLPPTGNFEFMPPAIVREIFSLSLKSSDPVNGLTEYFSQDTRNYMYGSLPPGGNILGADPKKFLLDLVFSCGDTAKEYFAEQAKNLLLKHPLDDLESQLDCFKILACLSFKKKKDDLSFNTIEAANAAIKFLFMGRAPIKVGGEIIILSEIN